MSPTLLLFCAYILGSVPFGLLLTQFAGAGDIRTIGSGNIGATNVLRTGRKSLAALTLFLDGAKGALAVGLAYWTLPAYAPLAGLFALLGHMFPLWLNFRGGKGVATLIGVMLGLSWPVAVMMMLIWLACAWIVRISSASALMAIAVVPIFLDIFQRYDILPTSLLMMFLVAFRHRANIVRLFIGTEPVIGDKNHDQKAA